MIKGISCIKDKGKVSLEECLKCSATAENKCHYTSAMIRAIMGQIEHQEKYHVTMLTGCLRSVYYGLTEDLYPTLQNLYYFFRGRAFHENLEHNELGYEHEIKVKKKILIEPIINEMCELKLGKPFEVELQGSIDEINLKKGLIRDYKSTKSIPKFQYAYTNHTLQLNIYLYLLQNDKRWTYGWEPQVFEAVYLDMSFSKRCKIKIMDYTVLDELIKSKLYTLEKAFMPIGSKPPLRKVEDLWACEYCAAREVCERDYIKEIKAGEYDEEKRG